ncbi:Hypothetical Protein FCC1311_081051 [Hondaea fermentalgiana]|uniref:PhoD-like phosphatase metallophosphatase domain-containing protein n=1 Tax=Hondaea fermentalgiana TaxID=2315210 RepID=A0A2R5FZ28_9STRA|nr:Hypothetical Protein FCC1311_081051 [Hondaea fermentalgiana]|eukprot:GBG24007.1 Hypothetical Protein FCC1311_081051 [Hondaea fermentalgiana]
MVGKLLLHVLPGLVLALEIAATAAASAPRSGFRIDFGSCNNVNLSQPLWPLIVERAPDAWVWGGDNIYADWRPRTGEAFLKVLKEDQELVKKYFPQPPWYGATPEILATLYKRQLEMPGYQDLLRTVGAENVHGIWDDHDYGINDGGSEYEHREASQEAFLKFMGVPQDDPRWTRAGIYADVDLADGRVKLILLDNRYHRDEYSASGDMLGEEQWTWLEKTLTETKADFNVLVSGIQVLPRMFLRSTKGENWERMPKSRARLMKLLTESSAQGVFFLSGDVHMAELMSANLTCGDNARFVVPEMTSSGMTHSWKTYPRLMTWAMQCAHRILPWQETMDYYLDLNFGELDFDENFSQVTMRIFDVRGDIRIERTWRADELKPAAGFQACEEVGFRGPPPAKTIELGFVALWFAATLTPVLAFFAVAGMLLYFLMKLCCGAQTSSKPKQA